MPRRSSSGTIHPDRQERERRNPAPALALAPEFLPMSAADRIASGVKKHLCAFKATASARDLIEEALRRGYELDRSLRPPAARPTRLQARQRQEARHAPS